MFCCYEPPYQVREGPRNFFSKTGKTPMAEILILKICLNAILYNIFLQGQYSLQTVLEIWGDPVAPGHPIIDGATSFCPSLALETT